MNAIASSLLILSALVASAEPPRAPRLTDYRKLWTDSPFTAKPPPPTSVQADNPLDDYTLGGISKLQDGYYAILINKKNKKRITISPDHDTDFEIVSVNWSDGSWKHTTVTVKRGIYSRALGFEEELVKVNSQVQKPTNKPNASPIRGTNTQRKNQKKRRAPRPRVVVPPNKKNNQNKRNNQRNRNNRRGR